MSCAPIAVSNRAQHSRQLSAATTFGPWTSTFSSEAQPIAHFHPDHSGIVHPVPQAGYKTLSADMLDCLPSLIDGSLYDACTIEQEHCTGYECCEVKLGDMHAVMNHYETAHRISRFGKTTLPVTALPVARLQPIVTPTVPVVPHLDVNEYRDWAANDWSSAPSPISTISSRAPSLSVAEDDAEYEYRREERMPQTPPANPYSTQRVMIVGEEQPQDAYTAWQQANVNGFTQPGYPIQQYHQHPTAQKASDDFAYSQEAASSVASTPAMSPVPSNQLAELGSTVAEMRSQAPSHVQQFFQPMEPSSEQAHFAVARHQHQPVEQSGFYSPVPDQHYAAHRAQATRQNSLHVATPTQANAQSYALSRSQSFSELPPPSHPYASRPVRAEPVHYAQPQPLAPSPSPSFVHQAHDVQAGQSSAGPQFAPAAGRPRNGSVPFPTPVVPPTLYSPTRRESYDQSAPGSADVSDDEFMGEDDYDEDRDALPTMIPHQEYHAQGRPPASSPKKSSKKTKSGRPRNPNRASAAKDPKRAKLFCPKLGCTKRYMNPNGLKYHIEKGTCSFESAQ